MSFIAHVIYISLQRITMNSFTFTPIHPVNVLILQWLLQSRQFMSDFYSEEMGEAEWEKHFDFSRKIKVPAFMAVVYYLGKLFFLI